VHLPPTSIPRKNSSSSLNKLGRVGFSAVSIGASRKTY
jgi:hypothetical protein